jgi:O-antigen/teichoic acid export membrane protein
LTRYLEGFNIIFDKIFLRETELDDNANSREGLTVEEGTFWQKIEAVFFPLAAAVVGIGYIIAILVNNPLSAVMSSPHALILMAIFFAIAFFPLRSFFRFMMQKTGNNREQTD